MPRLINTAIGYALVDLPQTGAAARPQTNSSLSGSALPSAAGPDSYGPTSGAAAGNPTPAPVASNNPPAPYFNRRASGDGSGLVLAVFIMLFAILGELKLLSLGCEWFVAVNASLVCVLWFWARSLRRHL